MAMNFKGRKEPQLVEPTTGRIDFRRLAEDIERDTGNGRVPAMEVSEYAPLREKVDHAGRLSMQEAADACNAIITDIMEGLKKIDVEHTRVHRVGEQTIDAVQRALKQFNADIVRHSENMSRICDVLEQVSPPAKPVESVEPITEEPPAER
jgi:hypothetical protein